MSNVKNKQTVETLSSESYSDPGKKRLDSILDKVFSLTKDDSGQYLLK